jgi:hypothetical protein
VGLSAHATARLPRGMLGLEKAIQLVLGDLHVEVGEQPADESRVFDLLDRGGHPEERLVVLAEVLTESIDVWEAVAIDRLQAGSVAGPQELVVPDDVDEGVTPVEEDGVERHAPEVRVPAP